jgi:hypothetical protein
MSLLPKTMSPFPELFITSSVWRISGYMVPGNMSLYVSLRGGNGRVTGFSRGTLQGTPVSGYGEKLRWGKRNPQDFIASLPPDNDETNGSSREAVFGIIFLENGLEAGETALQDLKK